MNRTTRAVLTLVLGVALIAPAAARAQGYGTPPPPKVQITPFVGYQFGGSVVSELLDQKYSFENALNYGGSIDFAIGQTWRLELYYGRQPTRLTTGITDVADFDVTVERLMIGLMEEKGEGNVKFFGALLVGATRFKADVEGFSSVTRPGAGLGLGVKSFFTKNIGLRLEGHAFWTSVESGGGVFCTAGQCLFRFSGSGFWQGDVEAGLILAF
jgi:hypothetical protein